MEDKEYKIVIVNWLDTTTRYSWMSSEDLKDVECTDCWTLGWLVFEDDKKIILAMSLNDISWWNDVCAISKGSIKGIEILKIDELPTFRY